jgi:hypothetical protein
MLLNALLYLFLSAFTINCVAFSFKRQIGLKTKLNSNEIDSLIESTPIFNKSASEFDKLLEKELSEFKPKKLESNYNNINEIDTSKSTNSDGVMKLVKDALSLFLIADFFVVIFFLLWFLAAAALQSTNAYLLERFQDIFNPVVVPSLTVLMVGSIGSGLFGQKKDDN